MTDVAANLQRLSGRIASICRDCGRNPGEVALLAVTKSFPASVVIEASRAGQMLFGENRVQEAAAKIPEVGDRGLQWHLIGPLQSNKARRAVELFDAIQTLDRPRIASRVERCAAELDRVMPVFIEVNVGEEPQKHGVLPAELATLVEQVDSSPHLQFEGLMAIPPWDEDPEQSRPHFRKLARLLAQVNRARARPAAGLSMGMSHDYAVAVQEGATLIRVGAAIFGPR